MENNTTGKQIRFFANVLFVIGVIVSILIVFFCGFNPAYLLPAVIIVPICCYVLWAITRCLKGFGELIDDTAANRANTDRIVSILEVRHGNQQSEPEKN